MLVKKTSGFSADRIKNDPKLARVKENGQEFGGSVLIGKGIRKSIPQVVDEMSDGTMPNRMTKVCRAIVGKAKSGLRGQRPFQVLTFRDLLVNFPFDERNLLEDALLAPYTVAANAGRNQVTVTVPDFNTTALVHAPAGATHFRIVVACAVVSSYTYDAVNRVYVPSDVASNGKSALTYSAYIPLGGNVGAVTTVVAAITPAPTLAATSGLLTCVGIDFSQLVAGNQYLMNGKTTMKVVNVF